LILIPPNILAQILCEILVGMFIVEACIQRDNNALDFPDNETSDVCVRDGENTIDPDDFLKLGVEVLPCQLYRVD
jgi:hypothetical protein